MAKWDVEVQVVVRNGGVEIASLVVELPDGATKPEIVEAAKQQYEAAPEFPVHESGEHTFQDSSMWSIHRQKSSRMAKWVVDIKVLYNDLVVVDLPDDATRDQIVAAAKKEYEENGPANSEYGEHVFDSDTWTVNKEGSEGLQGYIPPVRSVEAHPSDVASWATRKPS